MCRTAGEGFFYFPGRDWEWACRKVLSSKAVPEVLDMKYRSEFKHGFANRGQNLNMVLLIVVICTVPLKALHGFQEKRAHKSREMKFFLQNVQNKIFKIFKMFKNIMSFLLN